MPAIKPVSDLRNYNFYYQDEDVIYIVNIYDDREDFMYRLFGIRTTSEETEEISPHGQERQID